MNAFKSAGLKVFFKLFASDDNLTNAASAPDDQSSAHHCAASQASAPLYPVGPLGGSDGMEAETDCDRLPIQPAICRKEKAFQDAFPRPLLEPLFASPL